MCPNISRMVDFSLCNKPELVGQYETYSIIKADEEDRVALVEYYGDGEDDYCWFADIIWWDGGYMCTNHGGQKATASDRLEAARLYAIKYLA